ncbi:hypothetical protein KAR91_80520 [Candidatus Pacearchaeota archaeon]|nr:hypothetical protein [Candidatus Pacearchaeota archaeon]
MTTILSAGHLAEMVIAEEVTKGTPPAITTGLRDYFFGDPVINPAQTVIDLGNIQNRHMVGHALSDYHMTGSPTQIVTPNGHLGYWLGMAIGAESSAQQGGSAAYLHTYTPADDLKTFSMWYKRGGNQQVVIPYGLVNTLLLEQAPNDVLRSTVGLFGQTETIDASDITTADTYDTAGAFHNMDLAVTGPTNAAKVYKSSILIDNKYDVEKGKVHGSRFYEDAVPGKRAITGTLEMWFNDDGDYQSFWGSSSDTTPDVDGEFSTIPLNFKWDTNKIIADTYEYTLEIDIPEVLYKTNTVTIEDRIKQVINWSAQYDTGDSYEIEAYLTNSVVSYP